MINITQLNLQQAQNTLELRHLVKNYLDLCGDVSKFTDNLPESDWARGFIGRHKLRARYPSKIKPKKDGVTKEEVWNPKIYIISTRQTSLIIQNDVCHPLWSVAHLYTGEADIIFQ